jgi:hypothetical protein
VEFGAGCRVSRRKEEAVLKARSVVPVRWELWEGNDAEDQEQTGENKKKESETFLAIMLHCCRSLGCCMQMMRLFSL